MLQYTRTLKQIFENYRASLSLEAFTSFENHVQGLLNNYITDLGNFPAGAPRGRRLHQMLEEEIAKTSSIEVSCKKGCGFCCHLQVDITKDEAEVLYEEILSGYEIDQVRLARLALRERTSEEWKKGVVTDNRCVFLNSENACGIYASRPSSCRKLSVTSDPKDCADPNGATIPKIIPMAEIILSAALNLQNNPYGPMAQMLEKRLCGDEDVSSPLIDAVP